MDTIGTVNFEDLFDFSPEPLDSNSNQEAAVTPGVVVAEEAIFATGNESGNQGSDRDAKDVPNLEGRTAIYRMCVVISIRHLCCITSVLPLLNYLQLPKF